MPPRTLLLAAVSLFALGAPVPVVAQSAAPVLLAQTEGVPPPPQGDQGDQGQGDQQKKKHRQQQEQQQPPQQQQQAQPRMQEQAPPGGDQAQGQWQGQGNRKKHRQQQQEQAQPQSQPDQYQPQQQGGGVDQGQGNKKKRRQQQQQQEQAQPQQLPPGQGGEPPLPQAGQQAEPGTLPPPGTGDGTGQQDRRKRAQEEMQRRLKGHKNGQPVEAQQPPQGQPQQGQPPVAGEQPPEQLPPVAGQPPKPQAPAASEQLPPVAQGADPQRLNDRDLRRRLRQNSEALNNPNLSPADRAALDQRTKADREELTRRVERTTGGKLPEAVIADPAKAQAEAKTVIDDRRPADQLSEDDLRARLQRNRTLLNVEGLSDQDQQALRERLRTDREALRQRAESDWRQQRQRQESDRRRPPDRFDDLTQDDGRWNGNTPRPGWEDVLNDRRPPNALDDRDLNRRIRANRWALEHGYAGVPPDVLQRQIERDRYEMRRRMVGWRNERYDWYRQNNDVNIGINLMILPNQPPMWRPPLEYAEADDEMLGEQLIAPPTMPIDRRYSVEEIEQTPALRQAMPGIEIDTIQFGFNEDFVPEEEIGELSRIGEILEQILRTNPNEVFLIEGHTDAVGSDAYNLDLSRRRAESVKASLVQYFNIRPENLETVGYGEQYLKIPTPDQEPENRRVTIRRITPLVGQR